MADPPSDLATRTSRIEDRQQIADLISAYNRTVDSKDGEAFGRLWSVDATYEVGDPTVVHSGRSHIVSAIQRTFEMFEATHHLTGNLVVDFDSDSRASSTSDVVAHVVRAGSGPEVIAASYFDDFVREDAGWVFLRRLVRSRPHSTTTTP